MSRKVGAEIVVTGNSKSAQLALRQAAMEANKLDAQMRKAAAQEKAAATSAAGLAKSYHNLKMNTDNAYAANVRYTQSAKLVTQLAEAQKWSVEQLNAELVRLAKHYQLAEVPGLDLGESIKSTRFHTANLAAQFNDIGVMMASGQSPFILGIQQGTQITQVMQAMGGTAKEQMKALGGALSAIISPMNILTIGVIAGAAALYQWATAAEDSKEKAKELSDHISDLTSATSAYVSAVDASRLSAEDMIEKYGYMTAAAREALQALIDLAEKARFEEMQATTSKMVEDLERLVFQVPFRRFSFDFSNVYEMSSAVQGGEKNFEELAAYMQLSEEQARRLFNIIDQFSYAKGVKDQARIAQELQGAFLDAYGTVSAMPGPIAKIYEGVAKLILSEAEAVGKANELRFSFDNVVVAAQTAAQWAANIGTAASGSIAGVAALGQAMWDLAQARAGANARLGEMAFGNSPGGQSLQNFGGRSGNSAQTDLAKSFDMFGNPIEKGQGGGGGGKDNPIEAELEQLRNMYRTQAEIQLEAYAEQQQILEDALAQKLITQQEYAALMQQVEETHQWKMGQTAREGVSEALSALGQLFEGSKQIGAGIALVNAWLAFSEALKDPRLSPWQRFAAAAKALAQGLSAVRNIKSASRGGGSGSAGGATATAAPERPLQATLNLQGPFASAMSGALGPLLDGLTKEAGDRGYQLTVRAT